VAGTHQVSDLWPGTGSSGATPMGMLGSRVLVQAPKYYYRGPGPYVRPPSTFWASDGTAAGTSPLLQWLGDVYVIGQLPNALLLNAYDGSGAAQLLRTDPTTLGTQVPGTAYVSGPGVQLGTELLWGGLGGLMHSNGTSAGSGLLTNVPGFVNSLVSLVRLGNFLFFVTNNTAGTLALWRTDGTANGTVQVFDTGVASIS